jgi:roadblock/LC7 domain-containing protein
MKRNCSLRALAQLLPAAGMLAGLMGLPVHAHDAEGVEFSPIGIPYAWRIELSANESTHTGPAHVGAWSWDEDSFPETAKGWTHTSAWVQLDLTEPVALTLTLESADGVPWPSAADPTRLAGTNLFPSFSLYRGWDTDAGTITNADGTTLDQDHTFNNRGNIEWAEDVTYLDHLDNATAHSAMRTWVLPAGRYTVNLGGNSPVVVAEGRQGYKATFTTKPVSGPIANAVLRPVDFDAVGIPYAWSVALGANAAAQTQPAHVGAWSWDEDSFPETAKGWTHTSAWVQLDLTEPVALTLTLESADGVPWPSAADPTRLAGTNLFPSFSLYRGWDTDAGTITNADGTTLDQDHTFNNRGNIEWAEDVTYLDHLDNATAHSATRTWVLPAGRYTVNLGGNSPVVVAEGRQGYKATFTTKPVSGPIANAVLRPVDFNAVGIPYGWSVQLGGKATAQTLPDHVGAWSWDEDSFPETAKGWTHTSAWVQLDLTEPVALTLTLESAAGVPWPSAADPTRLAGTNLFPSFSLYRGWDTDAGTITNADGTTLDQDHTFNNRGNIEWAEDVTYLDHLDNATAHSATRTWVLPAGRYTVNLGGNSPVVVAEGRQGYKATFTTRTVVLSVLRRDATSMTLAWPSGAGPLRRTDRIGGDWSLVEGAPSDDGVTRILTVPIGDGQAFYRVD